jgi:hypothetical protein
MKYVKKWYLSLIKLCQFSSNINEIKSGQTSRMARTFDKLSDIVNNTSVRDDVVGGSLVSPTAAREMTRAICHNLIGGFHKSITLIGGTRNPSKKKLRGQSCNMIGGLQKSVNLIGGFQVFGVLGFFG